MKKFYLILLSVFAFLNTAMAQELKVKSFGVAINDLTASVETVPDKNGDPCALVKILLVDSIAKVEGFVLKAKSVSPTEKWVYLSSGAKEVRIMPTHYKPINVYFPDFGVKGVEGKRTYILDLEDSNFASAAGLVSSQNIKMMSNSTGTLISIPVIGGVNIEMVKVEAGCFDMGDKVAPTPLHRVTLTDDYYLGKYEVTQKLWQVVMENCPFKFKGDNYPVEGVSWDDCQKFISRLNLLTGKNFRLPTEAEWEFAAKGGKKGRGYMFSGSYAIENVAWYFDNSGKETHIVGTKQPNELGIYDMSGNVCEWCQDWHGGYSSSSQTNPTGSVTGTSRVYRGGSCALLEKYCRTSYRDWGHPDSPPSKCGFRLALSE